MQPEQQQLEPDNGPSASDPSPATTRRPRCRYSTVDFSKLEIQIPEPATVLTVLFRPTNPEQSLHKVNSSKLNKELAAAGGKVLAVRDIRNGGLAVDFPLDTPTAPVLAHKTLLEIPVSTALPATTSACSGVISGIHWEIPEEEILNEIQTLPAVPVSGVKRLAREGQQSWVVKLTFSGTIHPDKALLFGRSYRVRPYENQPLQCFNCGRYGHAARVCRSQLRCWTCGQNHRTADCPNKATPTCLTCGGPHPANATSCPNFNFQRKVCEVKAKHQVNFKVARQAVTEATKSYAAALKGKSATSKPATSKPATAKPATAKPTCPPGTFIQNIAHPRPPQPTTNLAALFHALLAVLTTASSSNDLPDTFSRIASLFKVYAPGAPPETFKIPV